MLASLATIDCPRIRAGALGRPSAPDATMPTPLVKPSTFMGLVLCSLLSCTGGRRPDERQLTVAGDLDCRECRIDLARVVTLGDSTDTSSVLPNAAGRECMVGKLSTGEYVLSGVAGGGFLNVYSAAGKLVRTIGRKGGGPGEFRSPLRVAVATGDSLYVLDDANSRIQVVSAAGTYARVFPTRDRYRSFTLLPDDRLLLFRLPKSRNDRLFHGFDREGREVMAFGAPQQPDSALDLENWLVSRAPRDRFWTASIWSYELRRWRGPDSLDLTVIRKAEWFPSPSVHSADVYVKVPPPPLLLHAWEDDQGRLWTYIAVADPNWRPGMGMRVTPEWQEKTFDTIIEVIDLGSGRLLASYRYPGRVAPLCSSPLMYTVVEQLDGDLRVQVLEPRLYEPRNTR